MGKRSSTRGEPWDFRAVLCVLGDRIYNTCEINNDELAQFIDEIDFFVTQFRFELCSVQQAKDRNLDPRKVDRLEKLADEFEVLGPTKANTIRAWITPLKFGKVRKKDAVGQSISLISQHLKSACVFKPFYWAALLLAHSGAPLALLHVTEAEVSEIPKRFRIKAKNLPLLPKCADKVNARLDALVRRWRDSEHGKSCLAVFGEPSREKLVRSK